MKVDRITHSRDMVIRNFPSRHLGFGETGNSAIRSAVPENPHLEPNMKWIGWPVAEIWPFEILQNARSVVRSVGRSSSIYTLFSCTPLRYVRNVAKRSKKCSHLPMSLDMEQNRTGPTWNAFLCSYVTFYRRNDLRLRLVVGLPGI